MEIRKRVGLPRMSFHVMNRGARRAVIFKDDEDRSFFVDVMGRALPSRGVRLTSWSLMTNHYHLEPDGEGTPLTLAMGELDGVYARYFNKRHKGSGCLFQGPFKSMGISHEAGLAYVSRYIHLNPADMGVDPITYRWSSCASYLGTAPVPSWLDPAPVLSQFGSTLEEARANYRFYLSAAAPRRIREENPVDDFLLDYVGHLEAECDKLLGANDIQVPRTVFVCWYANRMEGVPFEVLRKHFGYASAGSVRAMVARFSKRLSEDEALARWAAKVNVLATRKR